MKRETQCKTQPAARQASLKPSSSPYPLLTEDPARAERAFRQRDELLNPLRLAADRLTETVAAVLDDRERFYRFAVREEEGELKSVDTRVLKELAATVKELAAAERNLHDIPTDGDRQNALIAAGKYRLAAEKATGDHQAENALQVLFGELEGESVSSLGE